VWGIRRGGRRAIAAALPRRSLKAPLFVFFFEFSSSFVLLCPFLDSKFLKSLPTNLDLKTKRQEKEKKITFCLCSVPNGYVVGFDYVPVCWCGGYGCCVPCVWLVLCCCCDSVRLCTCVVVPDWYCEWLAVTVVLCCAGFVLLCDSPPSPPFWLFCRFSYRAWICYVSARILGRLWWGDKETKLWNRLLRRLRRIWFGSTLDIIGH